MRCLFWSQHNLLHLQWTLLRKQKLNYVRYMSKPFSLKRWLLCRVFLWLTWFWLVWVLGTIGLKCTTNIKNYPAYSYHKNFPSTFYALISFKCIVTATNQANDLPKTGMSEKKQRMTDRLKDGEPEAVTLSITDEAKISWPVKNTKRINTAVRTAEWWMRVILMP